MSANQQAAAACAAAAGAGGGGGGSITIRQAQVVATQFGQNITNTFGLATQAGSLLVILFRLGATPAVTSVVTNTAAALTATPASPATVFGTTRMFCYYLENAGATTSITVNTDASSQKGDMYIFELTGAATSGAFDAENSASPAFSGAEHTVTNTTTANNSAILLQWISNSTPASYTAGYSLLTSTTAIFSLYDENVGGAGVKTVGFTPAAGTSSGVQIVAFKAA